MAIEYFIYTDIALPDLEQMLEQSVRHASAEWAHSSVKADLGPFHEEIMEEYGVNEPFKTRIYSRHYKDRSVEARAKLLEFFDSLPGRKLILNGDSFVDFRER